MKKLTSSQQARHREIVDKLEEYQAEGSALVDAYNDKLAELYQELHDTVENLGADLLSDIGNLDRSCLQEAEEFAEEVRDSLTEFFDARSEKWQESEKGQEYQSWIDDWEAAAGIISDPQDFVEVDEVYEDPDYAEWDELYISDFDNVSMAVEGE